MSECRVREASSIFELCTQSADDRLPAGSASAWRAWLALRTLRRRPLKSSNATVPVTVAAWAITPAPSYFASEVGDSFTPNEEAFEDRTLDSEPPRASDFSATVEWGDGSASPATVSEEGHFDFEGALETQCYQVRAPSHTYAAAGGYSLTLRVNEAETGLEHVFAPVTERVWTPVPGLRSGIPSGVLSLGAGSSWSGTIASFAYEMEPFGADYSAMVNWGAGACACTSI
jgi:hypothetical protein